MWKEVTKGRMTAIVHDVTPLGGGVSRDATVGTHVLHTQGRGLLSIILSIRTVLVLTATSCSSMQA